MPEDKEPIPKFAARIKAKYPEYKDVNDTLLTQKIIAKYPEYADKVDMSGIEVKKKAVGQDSGNAVSPSPSKSKDVWSKGMAGTPVQMPGQVAAPLKGKAGIADPVGDLINEPETKFNQSLNAINSFGREGRAVSESTQPNIKPAFQKDKKDAQVILQDDFKNSQEELTGALAKADKTFFKDGKEAGDYVKEMITTHPVEDIENNRTVQLAYDKHMRYEALKKRYEANPDITQLAVDLNREADSNLDKQILALEGGDEDDRGLDRYEFYIPQAMQGRMVDEFINDNDVKALAKENPNVKAQLDELSNGGVYLKYPEYGETVVRNILSREYQKRKANAIANPIFNKSKYLDNLSDEIFSDNPALKQIADSMKGNWEGKIDTGGVVDEYATGAKKTVEQMGQSFKDFLGAGKTEKERIEEGLKDQYESVSSGVTGWRQKLGHAANFAGMLTVMALGNKGLRALGTSPKVAHSIITADTFYDEEKNAATLKHPGEPWKANLEALAMTALYAGAGNALPSGQLATVLEKARPEISQAIKNISADAVEAEVKYSISNAVANSIKGVLKGTGEMVVLTAVNGGLDRALGMNGQEMAKYHPDNELVDVAEGMMVGLAGPSILSSFANRKAASNSIYSIASFPERYKSVIEQTAERSPSLKEELAKQRENINFLAETKKQLDERGISESNQKIFLLEELNKKYKRDKQASSPESTITRRSQKEDRNADDIQERILNGEDVAGKEDAKEEKSHVPPIEVGANEISKQIELDPNLPEGYQTEISKPIELNPALPIGYRMPESKTIETEVNIPSNEKSNTKEVVEPIEPVPSKEEVRVDETTDQNSEGSEPPKGAPGEPIKPTDLPDKAGITHAQMDETAKEFGLTTYEKSPESIEEWDAEADKRLKENPAALDELFYKLRKGDAPDAVENRMMIRYMAGLKSKLRENATPELVTQLKRAKDLFNIAGREWGKAGKARQGEADISQPIPDNLEDFLVGKESSQGFPLSKEQIVIEKEKFEELKESNAKLQIQLETEREEHARLVAEHGINKAKAMARKAAKKTDKEYKDERKASVDAAKEALRKLRTGESGTAVTLPGARELAAIAPHIKKIAESLAGQGIDKLDNIVSDIHAEFKDILDGLTKNQVIDIIAGRHDEKKETKNEKSAQLRILKREADLLGQIADARKGIETAKRPSVKEDKSRRITELEDKLAELKRANKVEDKDPVEDNTLGAEERQVAEQKKLTRKIEKLTKDLKEGNYQKEENKEQPLKLSRKTILLKDKVIELEEKIIRERAKEDYKKRHPALKAYDKVMQVLGLRRIVQTALDLSIPFRQGATLLSPIDVYNKGKGISGLRIRAGNIATWVKSFGKMLQSVFSPKNYSRMMYEIRHSEQYHDMTKDGIVFNELDSFKPENRNEDYQKSFIYHIPVVSEPLKASNRAADAFLNVARYELYLKLKDRLEANGMTRQSDPKAYEFAANWAMNMTGRGKMIDALENPLARQILGNTFYGARLMASRFNLLNPVTYFDPRVPKEIRFQAMKDMAGFAATTMAMGYALQQTTGAKVSMNPWDSDFLQVRYGDKVYDISGGLANYVKTFLRMVNAGYSRATGSKYEAKKDTEKAGQSALNFFRNKLSPNTAYATDWFFGKSNGQDFDASEAYAIYPMYADDAIKAAKEDGVVSLLTVLLPNILGIGYGNYGSKDQVDPDIDTLLERNLRSDELDKSKIKNYKDGGREINNKEFKKYIDARDAEIKKGIQELYRKGKKIVGDDFQIKYKPFKELTREEVSKLTSSIKAKATVKVKKELFGEEPEEPIEEKIKQGLLKTDNELEKLNQQ